MSQFKTFLVLLFMIASPKSYSQEKWTLTFRPELNFLTADLGHSNTRTGYGFEVTGSYRIIQNLDLYTGWNWNQFKGDQYLASENSTLKISGANLGLRFIHPISNEKLNYNLLAGIKYNHIIIEDSSGDNIHDTNYDLGWQFGGGITYTFGENWQLQPEIKYVIFNSNANNDSVKDLDLNYLAFTFGLNYRW